MGPYSPCSLAVRVLLCPLAVASSAMLTACGAPARVAVAPGCSQPSTKVESGYVLSKRFGIEAFSKPFKPTKRLLSRDLARELYGETCGLVSLADQTSSSSPESAVGTCPAGSGVYYFLSFYRDSGKQVIIRFVLEQYGCQFLGRAATNGTSSQTIGNVIGMLGVLPADPKLYQSFYKALSSAVGLPPSALGTTA